MTDRNGTRQIEWQASGCPSLGASLLVVAALVAVANDERVAAQCQYEVTVITAPPCGPFSTIPEPRGINDAGHVVGAFRRCDGEGDSAFLWTPDGGFVALDVPPPFRDARAADINDLGQIVGSLHRPPFFRSEAVLWCGGRAVELGIPKGGNFSGAAAINARGDVVGTWGNNAGEPARSGFVWRDGELVVLDLPKGPNAVVHDIADTGYIVGHMGSTRVTGANAFALLEPDTELLPIPDDAIGAEATGVNNLGHVAGYVVWPDDAPPGWTTRGAVWQAGHFIDLGVVPGSQSGRADDINDIGQVVGRSRMPEAATLWQNGVLMDLNDLIASEIDDVIRQAYAINNRGQIVARTSGAWGAILTPVNRPPTDVDADCRTGITDLLYVVANWGICSSASNCIGDTNDDRVVDHLDMTAVLASWD
ncbi:MAG: hypothetical protein HKO59_03600 [Phycisphaerales bacterium]|nr:hypothetical protein [Phycisphaerales bacterium]